MKTFTVYQHPSHGFEAVKKGFSWPAFFFGVIWILVKRLWWLAALWVGLYVALGLVDDVVDTSEETGEQMIVYLLIGIGYLALWVVPGFMGNRWKEANLTKRGFRLLGTVDAETVDAAVAQLARAA